MIKSGKKKLRQKEGKRPAATTTAASVASNGNAVWLVINADTTTTTVLISIIIITVVKFGKKQKANLIFQLSREFPNIGTNFDNKEKSKSGQWPAVSKWAVGKRDKWNTVFLFLSLCLYAIGVLWHLNGCKSPSAICHLAQPIVSHCWLPLAVVFQCFKWTWLHLGGHLTEWLANWLRTKLTHSFISVQTDFRPV